MLYCDPSQSLVLDAFNPGINLTIRLSGLFKKGDDLIYMSRDIAVPNFNGTPTQLVIPLYYDEILSLSCWKPVSPAGIFSCFVHAYIIQGGLQNVVRVNSLFSGWVSDSNPISYPWSDRVDCEDNLAGIFQGTCTTLPTPSCYFPVTLGMPIKVVGFRGTFVSSLAVANRNIGLGVDDGSGNLICVSYNTTNFPAGSTVYVSGCPSSADPITIGTHITVPLPEIEIANPRFFRADVLNADINDAWNTSYVYFRPYFNF